MPKFAESTAEGGQPMRVVGGTIFHKNASTFKLLGLRRWKGRPWEKKNVMSPKQEGAAAGLRDARLDGGTISWLRGRAGRQSGGHALEGEPLS